MYVLYLHVWKDIYIYIFIVYHFQQFHPWKPSQKNPRRSRGGVRADGIDNEVHRSPCEAVDAEVPWVVFMAESTYRGPATYPSPEIAGF